MWTTSSSHADRLAVAFAALLATACASGSQGAPEGPRAELRADVQPAVRPGAHEPVIEIDVAKIVHAGEVRELLPRLRLEPSADAVVVDVRLRQPLDLLRDAAASIVLNGKLLRDTVPVDAKRLIAAARRRDLRELNSISVTYLGAEKTMAAAEPVLVRSP